MGLPGVVVVGLDLVEVLTFLFLETILAVEDELEGVEGTGGLLSEGPGPTFATDREEGRADRGQGHEAVGVRRVGVGLENNGGVGGDVGEFQRVFLLVATLEKHQTSSLTGWLYERRTCLVLPEVTVSVPVCWTCSIRYS